MLSAISENDFDEIDMITIAFYETIRLYKTEGKHYRYRLVNSMHLFRLISIHRGFSHTDDNNSNNIADLHEKIQFGEFILRACNIYEMMCGSCKRFKLVAFSHGPSCSNCGTPNCADDCSNSDNKFYIWNWSFSKYTDDEYQTNWFYENL